MIGRSQNSEAWHAIMAAIRSNLKASSPHDAVRDEQVAHGAAQIPAAPVTGVTTNVAGTRLERFRQALEAVGGRSQVARSEQEAGKAIERIIKGVQAQRVGISNAAIVRSLMQRVNSTVERLEEPSPSELFACDIGVTATQWGIVETGTLVLESERERHRLLSLIPPVHIAILEASRICLTLGEALASVRGHSAADLSPTVTLITGPSRTSDIELILAIGVHGPQALSVIILDT